MVEMTAAEFRQVIDIDLNAPVHRLEGRHPLDDQEGQRQDHQHLLDDDRSWAARPSRAYAAAKGGLKMLTRNICFGVRRVQHPVQRHRPGLHRDAPDRTAARASGRTASRHPFDSVHRGQDPRGTLGHARRPDGTRPCSSHRTLRISSTATSSTSTAAFWPTSASSRSRFRTPPHETAPANRSGGCFRFQGRHAARFRPRGPPDAGRRPRR